MNDQLTTETTETPEPARPWWRKKRFVIPAATFTVLGFIGSTFDSDPAPLSAEDAAAVERVTETDEPEVAETTTTEAEPTTTTAAPTTTTQRPTTTTTPKVEGWDYDESYDYNMANLVGEPIDDDLQWQIDLMDGLLDAVDRDLDERYWAVYVFYADRSCDLWDGFIQIGIDQNWSPRIAEARFEDFLDVTAENIQSKGMTWVDSEHAGSILAAGMHFGGCEDQFTAFYDFVAG